MKKISTFLFFIFCSFFLVVYSAFFSSCRHSDEPGNPGVDTTSDFVTWQTNTFGGDAGSCTLNDVAIINDSFAYAVGAIYLKDSLGNFDPDAYNLLEWKKLSRGSTVALLRIPFVGPCSAVTYPPLKAIWAFSKDDILVTDGGSMVTYDGHNAIMDCRMNSLLTGAINKIFATSTQDIYAVGNNGSIIHYTNGEWQKIESGTDLQFLDIYGATDFKTGKEQILAVCTRNYPAGKGIFSIQGNTATEISSIIPNEQNAELFGVWFVPNKHYYIVGDGIYEKTSLADTIWRNGPLDITRYATTKIKANGLNDIFIVGSFGECLHWNGVSWRSYRDQTGLANGGYASVAIKGNLVIAVGENNPQAVITVGRR